MGVQQQRQPFPGYPGPAMPPRRGGMSPLKLIILLIGGVLVAMVLISLLSDADNPVNTPPADYQNENYQVPRVDTNPPELPMPQTYGEATQWLTSSPIYSSQIAVPVRCEANPIDLQNASNAALQEHFNELTGCLMRVFGPPIEQAGYVPVRPSVTIYTSPVSTRCGQMKMNNAAYCAADQQVYYASDLPRIVPTELRGVNYVVESVIAHEFAHAIQARTGILISEAAWEQQSEEAIANNFSRRLEVQADCWAGQFIHSVGYSVGIDEQSMQQLSLLFHSIGDDELTGDPNVEGNHGHGATRQQWFLAGTTSTSMGACNSFTVPDDQVR